MSSNKANQDIKTEKELISKGKHMNSLQNQDIYDIRNKNNKYKLLEYCNHSTKKQNIVFEHLEMMLKEVLLDLYECIAFNDEGKLKNINNLTNKIKKFLILKQNNYSSLCDENYKILDDNLVKDYKATQKTTENDKLYQQALKYFDLNRSKIKYTVKYLLNIKINFKLKQKIRKLNPKKEIPVRNEVLKAISNIFKLKIEGVDCKLNPKNRIVNPETNISISRIELMKRSTNEFSSYSIFCKKFNNNPLRPPLVVIKSRQLPYNCSYQVSLGYLIFIPFILLIFLIRRFN